MEEQASSARRPKGASRGTGGVASGAASKSTHVIDLRQSGPLTGKPPTIKPSRPTLPKKVVSAPARKSPPPSAYRQVAAPTSSGPSRPPAVAAAPARADAVPADFFDAPPARRRFWPAFWRFLLLLVILGLLICGGVYLYLKFYNP